MNFSFDKFLKPLTSSDKNIKIYDNNNVVKNIINPFNVKTLNISNNLIYIHLESGRNITLDFATQNETKQAVQKLQLYVDTLKNSTVPYYIQQAVELEAPNFTKGPTGSIGFTGSVGEKGDKGDTGNVGSSAYEIWLNTHSGSEQDFITSLIGPIGPTGPVAFGNTFELVVTEQSINATVEDKDIEIVTKGAGNLLFKIDRDGWLLKYGLMRNDAYEIWGSGSAIDDEGNIYTTGADYTSIGAFVTKMGVNGQLIWQKQVDFYSQGESITYSNGFIYILSNNINDPNSVFPQIIKLDKNGSIINVWSFDIHIDTITSLNDSMLLSEIVVDEDDNIYYVGSQYNSPSVGDLSAGITDMVIGKLNTTTLQLEWFKVIDGGLNMKDSGYAIKYKSGFVYVTGVVYNDNGGVKGDIFVTKINKSGTIIWSKIIGNNSYDEGISITIDSNSYIYISGYHNGVGVKNYYMKLDNNGNTIWSKSINNFGRPITSIEDDGVDSLFILSTQAVSSTPARLSTDLYLSKVSKIDGSIIWQQYIYTGYRDSIWGLLSNAFPSTGHRSIVVDPLGKSLYLTGLTAEGEYSGDTLIPSGDPNLSSFPSGILGIYHNSFLMSYDQKSLPEGAYGKWNIQNATFSVSDLNFTYNTDSSNSSITIVNNLKDGSVPTVSNSLGNNIIDINKQHELTLFSPNTELYVKGILTIDDLYTFPRKAGTKGEILTYTDNNVSLLDWKLPTISFGFNDYKDITNNIIGASAMDGIFVDPTLGPINGQFDDEFFEVSLPFDVNFMGITYSKVYVGSNSFITFGAGYSNAGGYTKNNPPLPGIFISAADRSCQKLYTKTINSEQFVIRYEGSVSPSGPVVPGFVEIEWEITFNKNSSILDVNIGNNDAPYSPVVGLSVIKNTTDNYKDLSLLPGSAFRILKGYGFRPVQANRLNYLNIDGLSYSVTPDPLNLGDDVINIDFSSIGSAGYNSTTLVSTSTKVDIKSSTSYKFNAGILNGFDQSIYTDEFLSSSHGIYMQVKLPLILEDQDHIKLGLWDNSDLPMYYVELTHNTPSIGSMIIYDSLGAQISTGQVYNSGDMLSIYVDGINVHYQINGVDVIDCEFITTPTTTYRFKSETFIDTIPSNMLSRDYNFESFRYYPTGRNGLIGLVGPTGSTGLVGPTGPAGSGSGTSSISNLLPTTLKTSDYQLVVTDHTIRVDATLGDVNISLPTASSAYSSGSGYIFVVKRIDSTINNVYLSGVSGDLIDGLTQSTLYQYDSYTVQSNGTSWDIL